LPVSTSTNSSATASPSLKANRWIASRAAYDCVP
jgi:hypothetical protein